MEKIEIKGEKDYIIFNCIEKIILENEDDRLFGLYLTDEFKVLHFYDVGCNTDSVRVIEYTTIEQNEREEEQSNHDYPCNKEYKIIITPQEEKKNNEIRKIFKSKEKFNDEEEIISFLENIEEDYGYTECEGIFNQYGHQWEEYDGKRYYIHGYEYIKIISTIVDKPVQAGINIL